MLARQFPISVELRYKYYVETVGGELNWEGLRYYGGKFLRFWGKVIPPII